MAIDKKYFYEKIRSLDERCIDVHFELVDFESVCYAKLLGPLEELDDDALNDAQLLAKYKSIYEALACHLVAINDKYLSIAGEFSQLEQDLGEQSVDSVFSQAVDNIYNIINKLAIILQCFCRVLHLSLPWLPLESDNQARSRLQHLKRELLSTHDRREQLHLAALKDDFKVAKAMLERIVDPVLQIVDDPVKDVVQEPVVHDNKADATLSITDAEVDALYALNRQPKGFGWPVISDKVTKLNKSETTKERGYVLYHNRSREYLVVESVLDDLRSKQIKLDDTIRPRNTFK